MIKALNLKYEPFKHEGKKEKKDVIEIESDKLAKSLESTSMRIAVLACQKYLVKQGYQVIKIT